MTATPRQTVRKRAAGVADRSEILELLSQSARKGHVGAMRLLLEELRRDGEDQASASSVIDELASKRKKTA